MRSVYVSNEYYDALLNHYGISSITTLEYGLKRIYRDIFGIQKFDGIERLTNRVDEVIKWIRGNREISPRVKQNMVKTILAFLNHPPRGVKIPRKVIKKYREYANELIRPRSAFGEKVVNNWITWPEFLKVSAENADERLILLLYQHIPPLHAQEYLDTIIVNLPKAVNYDHVLNVTGKNLFDIGNKRLAIRYHMTNALYGDRIINLPEKLIKEVMKIKEGKINIPLLPFRNKSEFNEVMRDLFWPRRIGTNILRKAYICHSIGKGKERKKIAYIMGHSPEAQEAIYRECAGAF